MKALKVIDVILTVLLCAALFAGPGSAQDENTVSGTVTVPTHSGQTTVTVPSVSVTGPNEPGVLITADNQTVSATVSGDVTALYGGVDMETGGNGKAVLKAGGIRGGFGVLAYIVGGQIKGEVDSITASGDTALEAVLGSSGKLQFAANTISSSADAVTVETGVDFNDHIIDSVITDEEDPLDWDEGDWDVITEDDDPDTGTDMSGKSIPDDENENSEDPGEKIDITPHESFVSDSVAAKAEALSGDVVIAAGSIDAGDTAVDIMLNDNRRVALDVDEITSEANGVLIELSDNGGEVELTAPVIDADEMALMINAPAGTVSISAADLISGLSAVDVTNSGGKVTVEAGLILGTSGLFIEGTSGTTTENAEDIIIENYGIHVWTHDAAAEQSFDPTGMAAGSPGSESQKGSPSVTVSVDGDITDLYEFPEEPEGDDIMPTGQSEAKGFAKDGEASEDGDEEYSTGIIVEAETAGTIEINVNGEINAAYGNEIDADNGAGVTVSVKKDVITTYGNRLSADNAGVDFSVGVGADGGSIIAGGKALDTLASSDGVLNISIGGDIIVNDSQNESDEVTAGIFANSMENGSTTIEVDGAIDVLSENDEKIAFGIYTENIGGVINVTVDSDVIASGSDAAGVTIINGSDSEYSELDSDDEAVVSTTVYIFGDLTGDSTGLSVDNTESTMATVFVENTISGDDASVLIGDETDPENLDLTVWKIELNDGQAVTGGAQASDVAKDINYLIKYAKDDMKPRVRALDENGNLLDSVFDYQYAKTGEKVYFRSVSGDLSAIYNGTDPLTKEEEGLFSLVIPNGGGVLISLEAANPPSGGNRIDWLLNTELPATGFSAHQAAPLPARPREAVYVPTGLTLQIPVLDTMEEIVTVAQTEEGYPVEWLGRSVGLLEQSSLPGEGITVLTGHNHLNTMEAGPFVFIRMLEAGDAIMVTDEEGNMLHYSVYGNYSIASDGFASLAGEMHDNSLVLITCEDESAEGGYVNRRVVLADLIG